MCASARPQGPRIPLPKGAGPAGTPLPLSPRNEEFWDQVLRRQPPRPVGRVVLGPGQVFKGCSSRLSCFYELCLFVFLFFFLLIRLLARAQSKSGVYVCAMEILVLWLCPWREAPVRRVGSSFFPGPGSRFRCPWPAPSSRLG